MKQIIKGNQLKEKMQEAINMLCDTVKLTLGPEGQNILINTYSQSPFITNDGVTVAENIESEDKVINTILEIAKEASLHTNELVGDGTTTTLVLLQSLFNQGLEQIKNGISFTSIKKELDTQMIKIIELIKQESHIPNKKELLSIASIAANDTEMGKIVWEVVNKVKRKGSIHLTESPNEKTYYEINPGYQVSINPFPELLFKQQNEYNLNNVAILVLIGYLNDLEQLSDILNDCLDSQKSLLIFSENYNPEIQNDIILWNIQKKINIFLTEMPSYGQHQINIIKDICLLTKANLINVENVSFRDVGAIENIKIAKDKVILGTKQNLKQNIIALKKEIEQCTSEYEKEFLEERLAMLEKGIATIYVGALTRTAKKEKLKRFEDSLCAIHTASQGVIVGEGITLLKISDQISGQLLKDALQAPINTIFTNAKTNYKIEEIKQQNYQVVYNLITKNWEKQSETTVLDPTEVVLMTIKNAISIASMLLSTEAIVINETEIEKQIDI